MGQRARIVASTCIGLIWLGQVAPLSGAASLTSESEKTLVRKPSLPSAVPTAASDGAVASDRVAKELQQSMRKSTQLAEALRKAADGINNQLWIGTIYNEINAPQHQCYVLGRLLGFEAAAKIVHVSHEADLRTKTDENAQALRVTAQSLDNFVMAAESALALSRDERAAEWDLDCAGQHGIPPLYANNKRVKPFFTVKQDGKLLHVLGNIEPGFSQKLIDALKANPSVTTVALGSGGGSVYEALRAGLYIRNNGLHTTLWNGCYSACPLVFFGGITRQVWSPYPKLGLHQLSLNGRAVPIGEKVYRDIDVYLRHMGINSAYVLRQMWATPPTAMNVLDYNDALCETFVVTWIQRNCTAPGY